jgi:hypothetical protein
MLAARVASIALIMTACVSGELPGGGSGSGSDEPADGGAADAPKLMWVDAAPGTGNNLPCKNLTTPPGNGQHNPGRSCFQNCHNGRHNFTLAGTLYTNKTGNTGFAGATITVTDSNNQTFDIVTQQNGNFWVNRTIAFPVLVIASACPTAVKMEGSATRDCNSCHVGNTSMQMALQ